jgi:Ser/Thr protein kinase RdoA (MazF antagonist)
MRERLARRDWPDFDAEGLRLLELFEKGAPGIAARLQLGRLIAVPLQPCLRDVWHDHLLFTGDEATGLVDAHACRADNVATDLARLLGSLAEDDRGTWDAGLAAYEEIRPLSPHERGLVELFDQSAVLLGGLTWLEWKCVEGRRFERPGAVVARLRTLLGRLERLVQGERGA